MRTLSKSQCLDFEELGYLVVENLIDPGEILDPVIEEYGGVLDRVADDLFREDDISSRYKDLAFGERITTIYANSTRSVSAEETRDTVSNPISQYFDFSLPFSRVTRFTPMWTGPAVFNTLIHEPLLDAVESLIGPELFSNPVQHVRIKPPEKHLPKNEFGNPIIGVTIWHQDHGTVVEEADDTNMLTVWFPLLDAPLEKGPLKLVPGSHKGDLLTHCREYSGNGTQFLGGTNQIPEKLFDADRAVPVPLNRGSVLFMHKRMVHCSLPNVSDEIRWSFDLRYNPTGQPTGRPLFPGFVARSRSHPEHEFRSPDKWTEMWEDARAKMATLNQNGQTDHKFNRWGTDHPQCA